MGLFKSVGVSVLTIIGMILVCVCVLTIIANFFLYPSMYIATLEKAGIYEYIDNNLVNAQAATFIAIPPEGSKALVNNLLTNVLRYIRSDTDTLNLTVQVDQGRLRNFFLEGVNNLTVCTIGQDPYSEEPCMPQGKTADQFLDEYLKEKNIDVFASDTVDLATVYGLEEGSRGREQLNTVRTYIRYSRIGLVFTLCVIIVLVVLLYLLQKPNTRKWLHNISSIFLLPAILFSITTVILKRIPQTISVSYPLLLPVGESVIAVINNKIVLVAGTLTILGIFALVLSFIVKNPEKEIRKGKIIKDNHLNN